jgi:serine protease Do
MMDRTPEGLPPQDPSDEDSSFEGDLPMPSRRLGDDSQLRSAESEGQIDPDASDPIGFEAIDVDVTDPNRTLIFHRFDHRSSGPTRPRFDLERERIDVQWEDQPDHEVVEVPPEPDKTEMLKDKNSPNDGRVPDRMSDDGRVSIQNKPRHPVRRSDPVRHGIVMLATVFAMLATARFVLPGIVEEIRYAQHRGQLRAEFEVAGEGLRNVSLDTLSQAYQMVNAAAGPSVVHIDIHRTSHESTIGSVLPGAPSILISDQGSGVIVDAEGYVLTNRHVVATSDEISVTLSDGRTVDAQVVGTDELTDLAVLKVNADKLIPIPWGDSERIRVGSPVWAIGSPFGLDRTVTFGILSGKHRVVRAKDRYQDFMQSDVAVNPGNSGGPLVDSRGTLIGINTAIVGDTYQGVSFAIPSGIAKKIYLRLRENGSIERGWLGVSLAEVPNDQLLRQDHRVRGALIVALADQNSGAARAGLKPGDIVVEVDSEKVRDVDHLMQVIGNAMAGSQIQLSVARGDRELKLAVSLGRRPDVLNRR